VADAREISAPEFDQVEAETGLSTRNALSVIWNALMEEIRRRRQEVRLTREHPQPKVLRVGFSANQNNFDLTGAGILVSTGAAAVDLTGFKAPNPGESYSLLVFVTGAGTVTLRHNSGSSLAEHRIRMFSAGDVAIATDKSIRLHYFLGLWREESLV
jgi:hypothetical protein